MPSWADRRLVLHGGFAAGLAFGVARATSGFAMTSAAIIDDFSQAHPLAADGARWQALSDNVMGGVSQARMARELVGGRPALRLTGSVRLENNGGFVQAALDLAPDASSVDGRGWSGIEIDVFGPPESYGLHLRTADLPRPWQSYRQVFTTTPGWRTARLPFSGFMPYRTETTLDLSRLSRLGVIAIGRAFEADVAVAGLRFYR